VLVRSLARSARRAAAPIGLVRGYRAVSDAHYYAPRPSVTSRRSTVVLGLPDRSVTLMTDRGVFAHEDVDVGTKLLLQEAPPLPDGPADVLDLGCGYGPIAVVAALRAPDATVWAIDVNERARELCAENAAAAGVAERVRVLAPDDVPGDVVFDAIRSNPPVRVGKAAQHELLERWLPRLRPGAAAVLVVQKHLGSDSLATWMTGRGWRVERLLSRAGYRLLQVQPS
jgi:16S rRNA (guanine1207-N2)-methyltransferase